MEDEVEVVEETEEDIEIPTRKEAAIRTAIGVGITFAVWTVGDASVTAIKNWRRRRRTEREMLAELYIDVQKLKDPTWGTVNEEESCESKEEES